MPIQFRYKIIFFLLSLLYIGLSMHTPIAILSNAVYDDSLFINHAINIANGGWLGGYNQLTLAKGPMYSVFLAINYFLGLPVTLAHSLLFLFAVYFFIFAISKFIKNKYFLSLIFVVTLFNPAVIPFRVIRDYITGSLVMIMLSCIIMSIYALPSMKKRSWFSVCSGFVFGLLWLTREDVIWLVPGIIIFYMVICKKIWCIDFRIKSIISFLGMFLIGFLFVNTSIQIVNKIKYGQFITVDFKEHNFEAALNSLQSVRVGNVVPFVPVPGKVRNQIYQVSSSFTELKSYLESDTGFNSKNSDGCKIYPDSCGDYAGGWFMWAFRDAVAHNGHYKTAEDASSFYRKMAHEIKAACFQKKLICATTIIPFFPAVTFNQIKMIPNSFLRSIKLLIFVQPPIATSVTNMAIPTDEQFLGHPDTISNLMIINGWYLRVHGGWFSVKCANDPNSVVNIIRAPSPDLIQVFKDKNAGFQRFEIKITDAIDCGSLDVTGEKNFKIDLKMVQQKHSFISPHEKFWIDNVQEFNGNSKLISDIIVIYHVLLPIVGLLGILSYLFLLYRRSWLQSYLSFTLCSVIWVMILSRIILLVLVDISSFPAVDQLYMEPLYILFPLTCIIAGYEAATILLRKK